MISSLFRHFWVSRFPKSYSFCNTKFIDGLKKQRARLLQQNPTDSYRGYLQICGKAKRQFGDDYEQRLMREGITPPVPGLIYLRNFVSDPEIKELKQRSWGLYDALCRKQQQKSHGHKSYNHNLASEKHYKVVNVVDESSERRAKVDGQMFRNYGSVGHDLTYFIDNKNIPQYVWQILVKKLQKIQVVEGLKREGQVLNWRLTFNTYKENKGQETAFLWHKDIAVNGIITSITTVLGQGYFQIRDQANENVSYKLLLTPKSLVVLSGESRWRWVHRVIRKDQSSQQRGSVARISLVLGCK